MRTPWAVVNMPHVFQYTSFRFLNNSLFFSALFRDGVCYKFVRLQRTFLASKLFYGFGPGKPVGLTKWGPNISRSRNKSSVRLQRDDNVILERSEYRKVAT